MQYRILVVDDEQEWLEILQLLLTRKGWEVHTACSGEEAWTRMSETSYDLVICDTAGRLHNKQNLMNELNKISRILDRELPGASKEVLLVLDGTTGQNGLLQARQFQECAGVTGMVLTKLDGTAKGGICVAIAQELGVPVKFVGLGEGIDDLQPFDAKEYVNALI